MSVDASDRPAGEPSDLDREEFARLFSRNDLVLDAETIEDVAKDIMKK